MRKKTISNAGGSSHCPNLPPDVDRRSYIDTPMTDWFSIKLLIRTGPRTLLSKIFAQYSDKRTILAAVDKSSAFIKQWAGKKTVRVDYVADLGDGWDSTYSVAWCLAQPTLDVKAGDKIKTLSRGDILVMGGDQVYPFASSEEYKRKLVRPYRAALPCTKEKEAPTVFAIPGNHDWYDGLSGFMRRFGQGSWLGGWRTQQRQSYFAIKLPHGWWLWGVDTQLGSYIDRAQQKYFRETAEEHMKEGDRIILCVAEPSWVFAAEGDNKLHRNLNYLEENIIVPNGGEVSVTLAGDLHHYAHYQQEVSGKNQARHKITCGGGGAFTHGTHHLPKTIQLCEKGEEQEYALSKDTMPSQDASSRMLLGNFFFPLKHLSFTGFVGLFYLLYAWVMTDAGALSVLQAIPLESDNLMGAIQAFLKTTIYDLWAIVFLTALFAVLIVFAQPDWRSCPSKKIKRKWLAGLIHGAVHVVMITILLWFASHWNNIIIPPSLPDWDSVSKFSLSMFVFGGLFGSFVFGMYLLIGNLFAGFHRTEAFSALENKDHKSFLRMEVSKKELVIYPIGLKKTAQHWRWEENESEYQSWVEPSLEPLKPEIIGEPIRIKSG